MLISNLFTPERRESILRVLGDSSERKPLILNNLKLHNSEKLDIDSRLWTISIAKSDSAESLLIFQETTEFHDALIKEKQRSRRIELRLQQEYDEVKSVVRTLKDLFGTLPDSFLLVNRLGVIEQAYITDRSLFSKEPLADEIIWDVFENEIHPNLWALMQRCRLTHQEQSEEILVERDQGKRWFEIHVHPSGTSFSIILKDITEKNRSLEQLVEEERLSSIGTLAGGLAHQYNNIHHAVLGFLQASLELKGKEQSSLLKKAITQLEGGASLTKSLLDFSRGHAEKGMRTFYLKEVFEQVQILTKEELLKLDCTLSLPDTEEIVHTNKVVLEQILVNLVINAAHACLTSMVKKISLTVTTREDMVQILVKDTGCGVAESNRKKIFTPFFSTKGEFANNKSPQAQIRGNGLGLALSRRLARQFHGELLLKETSHQGTTFEVDVPRGSLEEYKLSQIKFKASKVPQDFANRKLNFMILDDLPENRVVLKFYLKDKAKSIIEFESGDVSLEELEKFNPDVIFVDWLMPGMNGNQFLSRLKEGDRFDVLKKAFVLSGYNNSEEIEAWRPLIGGVIEKPISREKLITEVLASQ